MKILLKNIRLFMTVGAGAFISTCGFADQITKLLPKQSAAAIETTNVSGYKKGASLCFEDSSGQKVGCGKVVKLGTEKIYVRFSKAVYDKLSTGLVVAGQASGQDGDKSEKSTGEAGSLENNKAEKPIPKVSLKKVPSSVRFLYLTQPISPVVYSNLTYDNTQNPKSNPWVADSATKSSFLGVGAEGRIGLAKAGIDLGISYRKTSPATITSNYISNSSSANYLENIASLTAIRFWGDYVKYFPLAKTIGIPLKMGLDFDMSTVTFASTVKNDVTTVLSPNFVNATSTLNLISLRVGGGIDWKIFGPVGINTGAVLLIPITQIGGSFSADNADTNYAAKPDNKVSDIQAALGHQKSSFGFEATVGMFAAF